MTTHRLLKPVLRFFALTLLLILLVAVHLPTPAQAAAFNVATAAELITAINTANGNAAADTITLTANISLTAALPQITSEITIEGGGYTINGQNLGSVGSIFNVNHGDLALNNITLTGGTGTADAAICTTPNVPTGLLCGGAVYSKGSDVTITNSTITNNTAHAGGGLFISIDGIVGGTLTLSNTAISGNSTLPNPDSSIGGGIFSNGVTTVITNSSITGNSSGYIAGGVYNLIGQTTITNSVISENTAVFASGGIQNLSTNGIALVKSTISGNSTSGNGGGISNWGGTVTITNSTVSGNSAVNGGGIDNVNVAGSGSATTVTNSTVAYNSASTVGGNLRNGVSGDTLTVKNSLVAYSTAGGNCAIGTGTWMAIGINLANDSSCGFGAGNNNASINLDPLKYNGGPTRTHALLSGSSAIDAAGTCGLATDQRGYARESSSCDVGAYEDQKSTPEDSNLVSNGDFSAGQSPWTFFGDITGSVSGGVMRYNRTSPGWKIATAFQEISMAVPPGSPMQVSADVGNSSGVPKGVEILFRAKNWAQYMTCSFTVPPNTMLTSVLLQDTTKVNWPSIIIAFRAYDPDGIGSITVDNVDVQYKPSLSLTGMNCTGYETPGNSELLNNGDFTAGRKYWLLWGDFSFSVNAGVMAFYRTSGATRNAVLFADAAYHMQAGQELELSMQVGNSSGVTKNIQVFVRDANWAQNFQCSFAIPANTALTTVSVKGTTSKQWGRAMVIVRALDADGIPAVLIDNVSLQYKPGITTTPTCDAGTLSVEGLTLSQPESSPVTSEPPGSDPPPRPATDPAPAENDPAPPATDPPANDPTAPANDPAPAAVPTDPPPPPAQPEPSYTLADLESALVCVTHGGASQALTSHLDDLPQFLELLDIHSANGNIDAACAEAIGEIAEGLSG